MFHSTNLKEVETIFIEFSKEAIKKIPRLFIIIKVYDPNNIKNIMIKKKTEIFLPDKILKNWKDHLDLVVRIEDDGTGKILIFSSF